MIFEAVRATGAARVSNQKHHGVMFLCSEGAQARSIGGEATLCDRDDYAARVGGAAAKAYFFSFVLFCVLTFNKNWYIILIDNRLTETVIGLNLAYLVEVIFYFK